MGYKTYIQTMKNGTVAPPFVKFHVESPSAVICPLNNNSLLSTIGAICSGAILKNGLDV